MAQPNGNGGQTRPFTLMWKKELVKSDLSSTARLVAHTLSIHMNGAGTSCWPSMPRLANESALGLSTVRQACAELEKAGWIERRISLGGRGRTNHYEASFPPGMTPSEPEINPPAHGSFIAPASGGFAFNPPAPVRNPPAPVHNPPAPGHEGSSSFPGGVHTHSSSTAPVVMSPKEKLELIESLRARGVVFDERVGPIADLDTATVQVGT